MAVKTAKPKPKPAKTDQKQESTPLLDTFYGDYPIRTIATRVQLDRSVVKKRLDLHKYQPIDGNAKLKIYRFDAEMEARLLETDTKLAEAKTRRELAMAEEREIKVRMLREEVVDVKEFTEFLTLFAGGLYKDVCVRLPKRLAARLAKAETAADCEALLAREIDKEFQAARENYSKYFGKSEATKAA